MVKFQKISEFADVYRAMVSVATFQKLDTDGEPIYRGLGDGDIVIAEVSIKLHGTNAGYTLDRERGLYFQSREREVTIDHDNAGFALWSSFPERKQFIESFLRNLLEAREEITSVTLFGEFCGKGIQKGVACSQVDKFFAPFALRVTLKNGESFEAENWKEIESKELGIIPVSWYQTSFSLKEPQDFIDTINQQVGEIENEDPFMLEKFGVSGIGEGVVVKCWVGCARGVSTRFQGFRFKAKGEKHRVTKTAKAASVSNVSLEDAYKFAEYAATENRVLQAIDTLGLPDLTKSHIPSVIKWVIEDIKSEEMPRIEELGNKGIPFKAIQGAISKEAVKHYLKISGEF